MYFRCCYWIGNIRSLRYYRRSRNSDCIHRSYCNRNRITSRMCFRFSSRSHWASTQGIHWCYRSRGSKWVLNGICLGNRWTSWTSSWRCNRMCKRSTRTNCNWRASCCCAFGASSQWRTGANCYSETRRPCYWLGLRRCLRSITRGRTRVRERYGVNRCLSYRRRTSVISWSRNRFTWSYCNWNTSRRRPGSWRRSRGTWWNGFCNRSCLGNCFLRC